MASSRIFVKGLPPTISAEEFNCHFSKIGTVTDTNLMARRRIGYVGFKTPEQALKAVKYFNRTFIRMSKINVEIARPFLSDTTNTPTRDGQEIDEKTSENGNIPIKPSKALSLPNDLKRKRSDTRESHHKLAEFLEVMQPATKTKKWKASDMISDPDSAIKNENIVASIKNIGANQEVQLRQSQKSTLISASSHPLVDTTAEKSSNEVTTCAPASMSSLTDDEWLRHRTNRRLDLVDLEDASKTTLLVGPNEPTESRLTSSALNDEPEEQLSGLIPRASEKSETDSAIESIKKIPRLFVRNLPYIASEEDLKNHFSLISVPKEVHISVDSSGKSKGYAHIMYSESDAATETYRQLDGKPFQGRLLHIIPGYAKREDGLDKVSLAKLPFSKQNLTKKKAEASTKSLSWNSLYMDQDTVNSVIASRLGVTKAEMLNPTSADSSWKQALVETSIINETKAYFSSKGVDLDSFKKCQRGDTAILVKNFPFGTTVDELKKIFGEYGEITQALMPPAGTIAIIEFSQPGHAKAAFANLAYCRIKDSSLFLEKAPKNLFFSVDKGNGTVPPETQSSLLTEEQKKLSVSDLLDQESPPDSTDTTILFVRNLNFTTSSERLTETFRPLTGFLSARVKTKKDPKKPGQVLSMGFGFIEFKSKEDGQAALKAMDGYKLDGHQLVIRASHKGLNAAKDQQKVDKNKQGATKKTKIIIKNLPFEANRKDVRSLFGSYGKLRSVRLPKKFNNSTRGFAFADFVSSREAENAIEALKNTHLLGRRLVLEFATADSIDAEEEITRMQEKVSSQVNKVALQKLTGGGRNKFNMDTCIEGEI